VLRKALWSTPSFKIANQITQRPVTIKDFFKREVCFYIKKIHYVSLM